MNLVDYPCLKQIEPGKFVKFRNSITQDDLDKWYIKLNRLEVNSIKELVKKKFKVYRATFPSGTLCLYDYGLFVPIRYIERIE